MKNILIFLGIISTLVLSSCGGDTKTVEVIITDIHVSYQDTLSNDILVTADCKTAEGNEYFSNVRIGTTSDERRLLAGKIFGTIMTGTMWIENNLPRDIELVSSKKFHDKKSK